MHSQDLSVPTDSRESGVAACFAFVRLFLFLFLLWHLLLRSYSRFKRKCEFVQMKILFSPQTLHPFTAVGAVTVHRLPKSVL
jgi:hypothetical protein